MNHAQDRFRRMHRETVREFAQRWEKDYELKASESGGSRVGLELIHRISAEPKSVRPQGVSLWKAFMDFHGRGNESHAASEFPNLLGTSMLKEVYEQMIDWEPVAMQFCGVDETSKLETNAARPILSQLPNLIEVASGVPAPKGQLTETNINIQVVPQKLAVELEPKVLVNDDKGVFSNMADRLLIACKSSVDYAVATKMVTPGNSGEDSQAFYSATYHLNTGTTALTANSTGANTTAMAAWLALVAQRDNSATITGGVRTGGKILGLRPRMLVVSPTLFPIASELCTSPTILNDAGTALVSNQFAKLGVVPVMFDYYPDTTDWFVFADPNRCPAFKVAFLNGRTLPSIRTGWNGAGVVLTNFLRDDGTPLYPLHIEVDFPFKVNSFDFRGLFASIVAGGT